MVVAVITVNWRNGLLATSNGSELPFLYVTAAISLAVVGFGRYSLDAALGIADWSTRLVWVVLAGGTLVGLTNVLAGRQRAPARAPLSR